MVGRGRSRHALSGVGLFALMLVLTACGGTGDITRPNLTVTKVGTGGGTVTATDIDCGEDCTGSYSQGTAVVLSATPYSGSTFSSWGGDCSGKTCELIMDRVKTVTATFDQKQDPPLKVITGVIQGWTGEEAVVIAEARTTTPDIKLAEALINADGSFTLTLPMAEEVASALFTVGSNTFCSKFLWFDDELSSIEMTPSPVNIAEVYTDLEVYDAADRSKRLGSLELLPESDFVSWVYAASATTIKGECVTPEVGQGDLGNITNTIDLDLKAGWNDVIYVPDGTADSISTITIPAETNWKYYEAEPLECDPEDPECIFPVSTLT